MLAYISVIAKANETPLSVKSKAGVSELEAAIMVFFLITVPVLSIIILIFTANIISTVRVTMIDKIPPITVLNLL
jgi:hypothetical protein